MVVLVWGKQIVQVDRAALRRESVSFERVVVDLGAGDGRYAYRLARAHPTWFVLAVDASPDRMREASFRASRKPSRGGVANVRFLRAAVEHLPDAIERIADEIDVLLPWGSLLCAVIAPDSQALSRIARLGKPGARLHVVVNVLAARLGVPALLQEDIEARLVPAYAAAGIRIVNWYWGPERPNTSWGRRLSTGRPIPVVALNGTIERVAAPLPTSSPRQGTRPGQVWQR